MADNLSFVQGGIDRVSEAYRTLDERVQKLQKGLNQRRRSFERDLEAGRKSLRKQVASGRKSFEKRTRKQISELRRVGLVQRALAFPADANQRIEESVGQLLGLFRIASTSELSRIDRKLDQITRKLKEIEKGRSSAPRRRAVNGSTAIL
jgi:hypothetical protein